MSLRKSLPGIVATILLIPALAGCVEREFYIRSDPPGALVFLDGVPRGSTPLKIPFEHYGEREVELRLASYAVHHERIGISPPWYQVFPLASRARRPGGSGGQRGCPREGRSAETKLVIPCRKKNEK